MMKKLKVLSYKICTVSNGSVTELLFGSVQVCILTLATFAVFKVELRVSSQAITVAIILFQCENCRQV